jgi:type IV pilus assembly protein PilX
MHRSGSTAERGGARGAALAVGLILLLALTLLAIAGLRSARLDPRRSAGALDTSNAFEAAERGLAVALLNAASGSAAPAGVGPVLLPGSNGASYRYRVEYDAANGVTEVPGGGFSVGAGVGFSAVHFAVTATGAAAGGASATATQGYYLVGPPGG